MGAPRSPGASGRRLRAPASEAGEIYVLGVRRCSGLEFRRSASAHLLVKLEFATSSHYPNLRRLLKQVDIVLSGGKRLRRLRVLFAGFVP